jgi:hypothetical protein
VNARVASTALLAALATPATAGALPWLEPGRAPLSSGVASVEILRDDEPLFSAAHPNAKRRGAAARGAHLPLYGALRGHGCKNRWLQVGPLAWVCEDVVRLSLKPALPARTQSLSMPGGLPYRYHFVGRYGSLGYVSLRDAEAVAPDAELEPGFAVAIVQVVQRSPGDPFGLSSHGLWLPMRDLNPARPLPFRGATVDDGKLGVGWVYRQSATGYQSPAGKRLPDVVHARFEQLRIVKTEIKRDRRWFQAAEGHWLSDRDLRVPTKAPLPADLRPGERWVDVDLDQQMLTAYEGERAVFATLVSSGKGRGKSIEATPKGEHRIWVKLLSSDMDNLENEDAGRYYAIQSVPWVMYFERGYGLHGTFWHRSFGNVRSHGCVNLTPLDAQFLFNWTSPQLPAGWTAVLPGEYDRGTLVRVR